MNFVDKLDLISAILSFVGALLAVATLLLARILGRTAAEMRETDEEIRAIVRRLDRDEKWSD